MDERIIRAHERVSRARGAHGYVSAVDARAAADPPDARIITLYEQQVLRGEQWRGACDAWLTKREHYQMRWGSTTNSAVPSPPED